MTCAYTPTKLMFEEAKIKAMQYPFALVNLMSEMYLGLTEDLEIPWEEVLEARFFSDSGEIHFFRCEKEWKAVEVTDDGSEQYTLVKAYPIAHRFQNVGEELLVKEYLEVDDDGQMFVARTRICGVQGGKHHGEE